MLTDKEQNEESNRKDEIRRGSGKVVDTYLSRLYY